MPRKPKSRLRRKPARKRSPRTNKRRTAARKRRWRVIRRAVLYGSLSVLLLFAGLTIYLDSVIVGRFEGRRWTIPAHVYAQPLELYAGRKLSPDSLERRLKRLGYRKRAQPDAPGTYTRGRSTLDIHTRQFRFWDGDEVPQRARLRFAGDVIAGLNSADHSLPLLRLDPLLIGSIYPGSGEDRMLVTTDSVPPELLEALMIVEDRRFYEHHGLDPRGIGRAIVANLRAGEIVQGGSTLTQQLVKSYFLSPERTWWRKFREAIMAVLLELRYPKEEILNAYINEVYLGQDGQRAIHGFGLASQFYFNKPVSELETHESALLVGLVRGPSYYDPRRQAERARIRRDAVLGVLAEQAVISTTTAQSAAKTPLGVTTTPNRSGTSYPGFMDLVKRQLRENYREDDLTENGLQIFTSFDPALQSWAERTLQRSLAELDPGSADRRLQGAVVVTTTDGAEVLALVGGRDAGFEGFNRVLDGKRPIGSLIKPVVYLTAFEHGSAHNGSAVEDAPIEVSLASGKTWTPQNYDGRYLGSIPAFRALAESRNTPTVRLGMQVGIGAVAETLRKLGVTSEIPTYPSLLLGAVTLPPLEVAQIYNTLANEGFRSPLNAVREVLDSEGQPLRRYPFKIDQVSASSAVVQLNQGLIAVMEHGTGQYGRKFLPPGLIVAGKTGTTDELRDSWFAGFSGNRLAVVWVGYDDNSPMGLTGSSGALVVWARLMNGLDNLDYTPHVPAELQASWIDYEEVFDGVGRCAQPVQVALPVDADVFTCDGNRQVRREGIGHRLRTWFRRLMGQADTVPD